MQTNPTLVLLNILGCFLLSGCEGAKTSNPRSSASQPITVNTDSPNQWWGQVIGQVSSTANLALETLHDGTGWLLGKNKVSVEQQGDPRPIGGGKYVRDFKILVTSSNGSYSSILKDVECTELGIPNSASQEKFKQAVAEIKEMLRKIQC